MKNKMIVRATIHGPQGCGKTTMAEKINRLLLDNGFIVAVRDDENEVASIYAEREPVIKARK